MNYHVKNGSQSFYVIVTDGYDVVTFVMPGEDTKFEHPSGSLQLTTYDSSNSVIVDHDTLSAYPAITVVLPMGYTSTYSAIDGISGTYTVPVIGTVTTPDWAKQNPEMAVFFLGFAFGAGIMIFRAVLRWWKRADGSQGEV